MNERRREERDWIVGISLVFAKCGICGRIIHPFMATVQTEGNFTIQVTVVLFHRMEEIHPHGAYCDQIAEILKKT